MRVDLNSTKNEPFSFFWTFLYIPHTTQTHALAHTHTHTKIQMQLEEEDGELLSAVCPRSSILNDNATPGRELPRS
jgi:hypothetical protein